MLSKAVFIDRDGTLNVEKGHVHRKEDFELLPGVLDALKILSGHGIAIYIVTNQAGIAKGYYTEEDSALLTRHFLEKFEEEGIKISEVLFCPHHPEATVPEYKKVCSCRKPATGFIESILKKRKLKREDSILIGDKNTDIEAGKKLGLLTYLVETGYGWKEKETTQADYVVPDFQAAVQHFLKTCNLPLSV